MVTPFAMTFVALCFQAERLDGVLVLTAFLQEHCAGTPALFTDTQVRLCVRACVRALPPTPCSSRSPTRTSAHLCRAMRHALLLRLAVGTVARLRAVYLP